MTELNFLNISAPGSSTRACYPGRDDDGSGVGIATTRLNNGGINRETVIECYYKIAVRPGMIVQPDMQYIASPSGVERDAFAIELRFILTL